jgi:hypothetical protein
VDPFLAVSVGLVLAVLALVVTVRLYNDRVTRLKDELKALSASRQSLATTYGRITEQWAPFMARYPYNPQNFRFLGSPVDGVQFEEDRVVFIEFKANTSRLTPGQQRIRDLVQAGKVEWLEVRFEEDPAAAPPAAEPAPPAVPDYWSRGS